MLLVGKGAQEKGFGSDLERIASGMLISLATAYGVLHRGGRCFLCDILSSPHGFPV